MIKMHQLLFSFFSLRVGVGNEKWQKLHILCFLKKKYIFGVKRIFVSNTVFTSLVKSFVFLYARYWCNNGNYYSYSTLDVGQYVNQYSHQIISRDNPELWILTFVQFQKALQSLQVFRLLKQGIYIYIAINWA